MFTPLAVPILHVAPVPDCTVFSDTCCFIWGKDTK